ncbi:MAG: hypothetical protein AVDCRST_MAG37-2543, partial [uncultured Rubrobacteraceae bacterium]
GERTRGLHIAKVRLQDLSRPYLSQARRRDHLTQRKQARRVGLACL